VNDSKDSSGVGALKNKNGFVWAVRYIALAYERYRLAHIARDLVVKGKIVICDRYPTNSPGKMDSPRIGPGGSKIVEKMRSYELQLYERVPKADALIFLDVSQEEAIERNRKRIKKDKETDEVIVFRHKENQGLDYRAHQVFFVDANRDYDSVLKKLRSIAWKCLWQNSNQ
jgi:thymidylate kinase